MNKLLYNQLIAAAGDGKLPLLDNKSFELLNATYGKEQMRLTLAEYIARERPVFPLTKISYNEMRDKFYNLQKFDASTICIPKEQVVKEVFEKYDDYKYPYSKYGLGLINGSSAFNKVSNYFHQDLRLNCGSYGFRAPKDVWENGTAKDIWKCLGPIWRGINKVHPVKVKELDGTETEKLLGGSLTAKCIIEAFRLQTYIATQFKPVVAKAVYDIINPGRVLDTSCGWGDRLAGFYTSNACEYIGCDPNPNVYKAYMNQVFEYEKLLGNENPLIKEFKNTDGIDYFQVNGGKKHVRIFRCGAENLPWDQIKDVDCAFTSPPYFATERYNEGGEFMEDQSWNKFSEYAKWRDGFYLPVSKNSFNSLSKTGHMFINIMDPNVKGVRYHGCDELVDSLKEHFVGQIGMRIMQRPQGRAKFKTEEELKEFMNKLYIENVWCFSKQKLDYFRHTRKANLDNFFG